MKKMNAKAVRAALKEARAYDALKARSLLLAKQAAEAFPKSAATELPSAGSGLNLLKTPIESARYLTWAAKERLARALSPMASSIGRLNSIPTKISGVAGKIGGAGGRFLTTGPGGLAITGATGGWQLAPYIHQLLPNHESVKKFKEDQQTFLNRILEGGEHPVERTMPQMMGYKKPEDITPAEFEMPELAQSPEEKAAYLAIMKALAAQNTYPSPAPTPAEPAAAPAPRELNLGQNFVAGAARVLGNMSFSSGPEGLALQTNPQIGVAEDAARAEQLFREKQLALEAQKLRETTAARQDETARWQKMIEGQNLERQANLVEHMHQAALDKYNAGISTARLKFLQQTEANRLKLQKATAGNRFGGTAEINVSPRPFPSSLWNKTPLRSIKYRMPVSGVSDINAQQGDEEAVINNILSGLGQ